MLKMTDTYQATPRNVAYLMERACVAAANAESDDAIGWRRLYRQDARNLVAMARAQYARALGAQAPTARERLAEQLDGARFVRLSL